MECPRCRAPNTPGSLSCIVCDSPLPDEEPTVAVSGSTPIPLTPAVVAGSVRASASIGPGTALGGRYEILQVLGEGGMGVVYKARDRELDRVIALKVIRPGLASNPDIVARFKQELLLARQVTHKNVIRIFDLSEAEGLRFITMEYVEGLNLKAFITQATKLPAEDATQLIKQVCQALQEAHEAGVVHRDLKPQNIMMDGQGRVKVMDFGLARSAEMAGLTQTGGILGTPEYMSPEQVKGEEADARSDLFSLGIVFYELLTGRMPFQANTPYATLWKRVHDRAIPPAKLEPSVSAQLSQIVAKCLEPDRESRYQSAEEILRDLETGPAPPRLLRPERLAVLRRLRRSPRTAAVGIVVLGLVLAGALWGTRIAFRHHASPVAAQPTISLAILPFSNASGEPPLDWLGNSLADWLTTDVGQSADLRTVSSDRLSQVLRDLRIKSGTELGPDIVQHVAKFSNAQMVVFGRYAKLGDRVRIDATLRDFKDGRDSPFKVEASGEKDLPNALDRLAQEIRQKLASSPADLQQLEAQSFKPSSNSVEALRDLGQGLDLARQGNNLEALKFLQASTQEDPGFAYAFAREAEVYSRLGYDNKAEEAARQAVDLSGSLPPAERGRIGAIYARIARDYPGAIQAYEALARLAPNDSDIGYVLGGLYEDTGELDKARQHYALALKSDPNDAKALLAMGRVEIKSGSPQASLDDLSRALTLAIEANDREEQALVLQATGIAYKQLNKLVEALRNYQQSLSINRELGQKRGIAANLNEMAQLEARIGKPQQALGSFQEAMRIRTDIGDKGGLGDTLIDLANFYDDRGEHDKALEMYRKSLQLQEELGNQAYQALCLNDIASVYFEKSQYPDALSYFQRALELREKLNLPQETADTLHNLAETQTALGQYSQALDDYLHALQLRRKIGDQRGSAIESYSMGELFRQQGRYGAALSSEQDSVKTLTDLQDRGKVMAELLSGYGDTLASAARFGEARKALEEALKLARDLKDQSLTAEILNNQGDASFYSGDYQGAEQMYRQALGAASGAGDREKTLTAKLNLARIALRERRGSEAQAALSAVGAQAQSLGLRYLWLEASVYLAEAQIQAKDYGRAETKLNRALPQAGEMGLRIVQARAQYLLATALRATGKPSLAAERDRQALSLLEQVRNDSGPDVIAKRPDLAAIYNGASRLARPVNP